MVVWWYQETQTWLKHEGNNREEWRKLVKTVIRPLMMPVTEHVFFLILWNQWSSKNSKKKRFWIKSINFSLNNWQMDINNFFEKSYSIFTNKDWQTVRHIYSNAITSFYNRKSASFAIIFVFTYYKYYSKFFSRAVFWIKN